MTDNGTDPGLPDAAQRVALELAEHWGAGIELDGQWECSCGFPLGRADDAQDAHIAHQSAEVLAALDVPDLIRQAKADALEETARVFQINGWADVLLSRQNVIGQAQSVTDWLRSSAPAAPPSAWSDCRAPSPPAPGRGSRTRASPR